MAIAYDIVTALQASAKVMSLLGSRGGSPRVPFLWSSRFREGARIPPLEMRVNPNSVQFQQPKRIRKRNTQRGTTFFHFTDDRGRDLDILVVRFQGSTGFVSANPDVVIANDGSTLDKLRAWYSLYTLSREPMLDPDTGETNQMECVYRTPLFPKGVTLRGHFDQALDFTETADAPFQRGYSFSFSVHETDPDLDEIVTTLNAFIAGAQDVQALIRDAAGDALKDHPAVASLIRGESILETVGGVPILKNFAGA